MKRRFDGSYSPGSPASSHARISPDGPSTIVERRSAAVGAMMPIRRIFRERRRLYSEPVFVLPAPRPEAMIQCRQSTPGTPSGGHWSARAWL